MNLPADHNAVHHGYTGYSYFTPSTHRYTFSVESIPATTLLEVTSGGEPSSRSAARCNHLIHSLSTPRETKTKHSPV